MSDLLPVLVADLLEESARDFLESVARDNEEVWVPLVAAPVDTSRHLLEVYTPTSSEPLRLIAEPMGPPTEHGFPLRLSLLGEHDAEALRVPTVERVAVGSEVTIDSALEPPSPATIGKMPTGTRWSPAPGIRRADTPTIARVGRARRPADLHLSDQHSAELSGESRPESARGRDALIGRTLAAGKLHIGSFVGQGTMGAVYKALHRELRIPVAVKVLHALYQQDVDFCRRFYAEALAASRLDHPNLVRVFDFGQEPDGLLYISMELVAGRSLRDALAAEGPMSGQRIAEIMTQVCAGLGHAHARGIIHRDVKPDNVVLVMGQDDDGRPLEQVKVCDFGLALVRASDATIERFAGTPAYMSPEQCRGDDLDAGTDVYACGIVMYELATGAVPFLSDKPMVVIQRHLTTLPAPLATLRVDVDPRLEPIVQMALRKPRDQRHKTIRDLRLDLKPLLTRAPGGFDLETEASRIEAQRAPRRPPPAAPPPPVSSPSSSGSGARAPWLEDSQDSYSNFLHGMTSGKTRAAELSVALARDPRSWLTKLLEERDDRLVETMLAEAEGAARMLAGSSDARTLRAVSSTIHGVATDSRRHPAVQARARATLRVFADPTLLAPIAERLLMHEDDHRDAARALVLDAAVAGAYAMYGARVKVASRPSARAPFVETRRALGESAWPVVRAGLERIPAAALTGGHPLGAELAEDLLLCVPNVRDEAAGHLVAKYLRATEAPLCRAATQALARLWSERAAPLLLALLDVNDDGVRGAGILGLRAIGAVDEHVVRRLLPILQRKVEASDELRIEAVASLALVTPDARPLAVPILVRLVRETGAGDGTVLAASRALFSLMGNEARAVVIGRSDIAAEPLKSHLLELLRDPTLPEVDPSDLRELQ